MARLLRAQPQSSLLRGPQVVNAKTAIGTGPMVVLAADIFRRGPRDQRFPLQGWSGNGGESDSATGVLDSFKRTQNPLRSGWTTPIYNGDTDMQANGTAAQGTTAGANSNDAWGTTYGSEQEAWCTFSNSNAGVFLYTRISTPNTVTMAGFELELNFPATIFVRELQDGNTNQVLISGLVVPAFTNAAGVKLRVTGGALPKVEALIDYGGGYVVVASYKYPVGSPPPANLQAGGLIGMGIFDSSSARTINTFGGGNVTVSTYPLVKRLLGPRPPIVTTQPNLAFAPIDVTTAIQPSRRSPLRGRRCVLGAPVVLRYDLAPPIQVNTAQGLFTRQRRAQQRRTTYFLGEPASASGFIPPPLNVNCLQPDRLGRRFRRQLPSSSLSPPTVLRTFFGPKVYTQAIQTRIQRQRRRLPATSLSPPTVLQVFSGPPRPSRVRIRPPLTGYGIGGPLVILPLPSQQVQTIKTSLAQIRPRRTRYFLTPAITASTPVPPPLSVNCLLPDRLARRFRRQIPSTALGPPTVLQVFAAGKPALVRIRPLHTRAFLARPTVVRVPSVEQLEQTIRVSLVRARPRPTTRRLKPPTVLQTFAGPRVALVRTRPRPTTKHLGAPTVIRVPAVEQREQTLTVWLTRARPRPTIKTLGEPQVLQVFSFGLTKLVTARPRPRTAYLALPVLISPAQTVIDALQTAQVQTRPRATRFFLAPPTVVTVQQVVIYAIRVSLAQIRPRRIESALRAPTVLQTFAGPRVSLVHTRPRPTSKRLAPPAVIRIPSVEQREQTIAATLVKARPRPTRRFLAAPTVLQVFFGPRVALVKTRPRPTSRFLHAPTVVRIPSVERREQTIVTPLVHTRPRPTIHKLSPPTVVRVPSVEQREQTISVSLARIRPRPTTRFLHPPTVLQVFASGRPALVRTRTRPTTTFIAPPTIVRVPSVDQREETILSALVRTRPRPTTRFLAEPTTLTVFAGPSVETVRIRPPKTNSILSPPTVLSVPSVEQREETITAVLVKTRPRPIRSTLSPPEALQVFSGQLVALTRIKPRPTTKFLRPPTVIRVPSVEQLEQTIRVALVRTRPRPTTAFITPPTVLTVFAGPRVSLTHTRPRKTTNFLRPPTAVIPLPTLRVETIQTWLVHTRPRPTTKKLRPPTTLSQPTQRQQTLSVSLVHTRPRPTRKFLAAPRVINPLPTLRMQTVSVALVRIRPRPVTRFLKKPTVLATFVAAKTPLIATRPAKTHSKLSPPRVVRVPSVEQREETLTVALTHTRPRPIHSVLSPPQALQIFTGPKVSLAPIRPRPIHSHLSRPTVVSVSVFSSGRASLARIRPAATHSILRPPATLRVARAETTLSINLVTTRPRPIRSRIEAPTVIRTALARPLTIKLAPSRRPKTTTRLAPPTVVTQPRPYAVTTLLRVLAANDQYRLHHRTIHSLPKIIYPVTAGPCFIASGFDRPAFLSSDYSSAEQAEGSNAALGATSGRVVAEGVSDGKSIPDGAAGSDSC